MKARAVTKSLSQEVPTGGDQAGHIVAALALVAITAGIYGTIAAGLVNGSGDYRNHVRFAKSFYETGKLPAPHFLLHALIAGLFAAHLAPSFDAACRLVLIGSYVAVAHILYAAFRHALRGFQIGRPRGVFLLSLAVMLAEPINLSHAYQIGYLWPEPYSIPTSILMKPFALAGFFLAAGCLSKRAMGLAAVAALCVATVAGTLSKPSFIICIVPGAAVVAIFRLWEGSPISWRGLLLGLYLPAIATLGWQFRETYSGAGTDVAYHDSIIWAPLKVMSLYATNLPLKLALSALFPLTVTAICWRRARREVALQLGWGVFVSGAAYTYLVAEKDHWRAGNFAWSGYIATFVLFVASVLVFGQVLATKSTRGWPILVCGAVLALHVACGVRMDWVYLTHYGCGENYRTAEFVCVARPQRK